MRSAEMLVWMGDFNYRVDMEYDPAVRAVQRLAAGDREALAAMLNKVRLPPGVQTADCNKASPAATGDCSSLLLVIKYR